MRWTKQYWATRKGLSWAMSAKLAGPLEALKAAWGDDVLRDPVLSLGLAPTPIKRGTERYDSPYELVDLGRRKREAEETLEALKAEAKVELGRQTILSRDLDAEVRAYFEAQKKGVETSRSRAADSMKRYGYESFFHHYIGDYIDGEVAADMLDDVKGLLDPEKEHVPGVYDHITSKILPDLRQRFERKLAFTPRQALALYIARIDLDLARPEIGSRYSALWITALAIERRGSAAKLREKLADWLKLYDAYDVAKGDRILRDQIKGTPIDKQLAFVIEPAPTPIVDATPASSPAVTPPSA